MFETVARASANNPDVLRFGMAVKMKLWLWSFILANPALNSGEPAIAGSAAQIGARRRQSLLRESALSGGLDVYPTAKMIIA